MKRHAPRLLLVTLGAVIGLSGQPAPARAQDDGQFSITPARRDLAGRPPTSLGSTQVSNTTQGDIRVRVYPALLTQTLDGALAVSEEARDDRAARLILTVSDERFLLGAGTDRNVRLRWNLLPRRTRAVFLGIVFEGVQLDQADQPVNQINRLVSVTFLRLPGKYRRSGRITGLRGEQAAPRKLTFFTRVKNTGQLVDTPREAQFVIRDATGDIVFRRKFKGDIILPGFEREFPVDVTKVLPKGDYTAVSKLRFGASLTRREKPFTLVGPNELPTIDVVVRSLTAGATLGEDVVSDAGVFNEGTAPGDVELSYTLQRLRGATLDPKPLAAKRVPVENVGPGESRPTRVTFPPVPAGRYRVTLRYRDSAGELQTLRADFTPEEPKSFLDKLKDFFSDHLLELLIGGLGLLGLLLLLFLLLRRRRRNEEDEPGPQPAAAAASAPPAAVATGESAAAARAGSVNLNTAGADELATLPGVGPRAAVRIVDHREEYGLFTSVDALIAVEGFDAERVAQLRDRVTL